jgi:hypothetical protein
MQAVDTQVSGKRQQNETGPLEAQHKRAKGAINSIVKEYECPIALALPVDPVTAEDGRVYNRADIQKHINNSKRMKDDGSGEYEYRGLKSPMTNEPMGPNLLPAIQVRNSIRALIDSGTIENDEGNAEHWKRIDSLKTEAEAGDPEAMYLLSVAYEYGSNGLIKDKDKAHTWISKAADLNYPPAIGRKGLNLILREDLGPNNMEGGIMLGVAAASGDGWSQYHLGCAYKKEFYGITKNLDKAKYWIRKAISQEGEWPMQGSIFPARAKELLESIIEEQEGKIGDEVYA